MSTSRARARLAPELHAVAQIMRKRQPRLTAGRAKEIIAQARKRVEHGPWVDQLDKVMTPAEKKRIDDVQDTMGGSSSSYDALMRVARTPREVVEQAVRIANTPPTRNFRGYGRAQVIRRDPFGYLFVETADQSHRRREDAAEGVLVLRVEPGDKVGMIVNLLRLQGHK